jgi:murein DD-endopeptidase MepM/ murein hydrolase activator NlpD
VVRRAIIISSAAAVLVLTGSSGVSSAVRAGTSSAEAFGIQVSVPGQGGSSAGALSGPPSRSSAAAAFAFPADGSVAQAASVSSTVSAEGGNASATVTVSGLSLFGGEVTVGSITAKASARASARSATGSTAGSAVSGLAVQGAAVASGPGTVALGDWGTATVLQQSGSTYGSRSARGYNAGVTALHVHLNVAHAGLPAGTDVVVGYTDVAAEALPPQPVGGTQDDSRRPIKPRVEKKKPATQRQRSDRPVIPPVRNIPTDVIPRLTASGYVFPIYGAVSFTNTFNAPRATTGWHHGEDIFAPLGAPVLAVADGIVYSVGWNRLGGLRFWLQDTAGNEFYYAHLSAFSPLAINGAQVRAGDVIGFVGNTGDAEHTPYHLHFEIHPVSLLFRGYDGSAVPPYPYLMAWKRLTDLPFTAVSGWAPPLSDSSRAPRPGAILLQSRDISSASGLEPGSLVRAMRAEGSSGADGSLAGMTARAREGARALARNLSGP